jgi:hypothetical protein
LFTGAGAVALKAPPASAFRISHDASDDQSSAWIHEKYCAP